MMREISNLLGSLSGCPNSRTLPCDRELFESATDLRLGLGAIEPSIAARFEQIACIYPDRLAVKAGERSVAYDKLNRFANRIAHAIIARRGTGNEPIALLCDHGVDAIAAILGILKAGKAYVVLNDSFPKERNLYIAEHSEAPLILTNQARIHLAADLVGSRRPLLSVDDIDRASEDNPDVSVLPDTFANVLYTSGSTGRPKGVVSTHRNILTSLRHHSQDSQLSPDDRLTLLHSLSFGSSLSHFFPSLLNGASLFPFDVKSEGMDRLANWLNEEKLTLFHSPPALFRQLAESLPQGKHMSYLRFIRLSGAPITALDFELYKKHFGPTTKLIIGMGSSEARGICAAVVDHSFAFPREGSPVGYPEPGKKIILLDENGHEVKPGEVGEIVVKGANINQGYWKESEQTTAKFVRVTADPDERLYLTGDIGRMLPNGFLIHLGRKDSMVKIRGFRVDLGEIERALSGHPLVRDVGVIDWEREPGEKSIAAYVVARQTGLLTVKELYDFLRTKLPDYMIPSVIKLLDALPLINGKLNRTALPIPDQNRPDLGAPFAEPRDEVEKQLARLWADVLSVKQVGIHDNFFDLGGHSLSAIRLVAELQKRLGWSVSLETLLKSPTIAQLALRYSKHNTTPTSPLITIRSSGSKPPFFCMHGTDGYGRLAQYLGSEQPFYGLAQHLEGRKVRRQRIEEIGEYYLKEIQRIQPKGPYFLGGHSMGGLIAFEVAQQLYRQGERVALLALLDTGAPRSGQPVLKKQSVGAQSKNRDDTKVWLKRRVASIRATASDNLQKKLKKLVCETFYQLRMTPPPSLQTFYVDQVIYGQIYARAHRQYIPQPYSGRAVYLKSEDLRERVSGWEKLITGGLEVCPVTGNHFTMLLEPNVKILAGALRSCLNDAQRCLAVKYIDSAPL